MQRGFYILKDGKVVEAGINEWGEFFKSAERIIDNTSTANGDVSTVFLGLDHNFGESGPPLLFETMVFGGTMDQEQKRYATLEQAKAGHDEMLKRVMNKDEEE